MATINRPTCVQCGKPYGNRRTTTEAVRWPLDEEMPAYKGNGIVLKVSQPYRTMDQQTIRGLTMLSVNPEIRAKQEAQIAQAPEVGHMVASRTIWDGVSLRGGYKPFCTLRCALEYARSAFDESKARFGNVADESKNKRSNP